MSDRKQVFVNLLYEIKVGCIDLLGWFAIVVRRSLVFLALPKTLSIFGTRMSKSSDVLLGLLSVVLGETLDQHSPTTINVVSSSVSSIADHSHHDVCDYHFKHSPM